MSIEYDGGRVSVLRLPNGVWASYQYGASNGRLARIVFGQGPLFGGSVLGDLTYRYDAAGRRTAVGGSLARTGIPGS